MSGKLTDDISVRNNVKIIGSGSKTLMFGHGFGCDQNTWRAVVPAFENDYQIIVEIFLIQHKSVCFTHGLNKGWAIYDAGVGP